MLALASTPLSYFAPASAPTLRSQPRMDSSDWTKEAAMFTVGGQRVEKPWTSDEISDREGLVKLARAQPGVQLLIPWASVTPSRSSSPGSATPRSPAASPWRAL